MSDIQKYRTIEVSSYQNRETRALTTAESNKVTSILNEFKTLFVARYLS